MNNDEIKTLLRAWGSSGLLLGYWMVIKVVEERVKGKTTKEAIEEVARQEGITVRILRSRIKTLMQRMKKKQTEAYRSVWGNKDFTIEELIERLAAEVYFRETSTPPHQALSARNTRPQR